MKRFSMLAAVAAISAAIAGTAAAAPFGQHVAMCAHQLGARDGAPAVVTCTHDGMTMDFATFGAMVNHMRVMH